MAYIQLTRGFITLIDDDLLDELNSHLWHASGLEGRPARRLKDNNRRMIFMYHQILNVLPWQLRGQGKVVDHINHDPLDNRKCNIRVVTIAENNLNRAREREGIGYDSTHDRWKVYIDRVEPKRINIGTFKTLPEAKEALLLAKLEMGLEDY